MTNTGKDLENLVYLIEKAYSPLGFNIQSRKKYLTKAVFKLPNLILKFLEGLEPQKLIG